LAAKQTIKKLLRRLRQRLRGSEIGFDTAFQRRQVWGPLVVGEKGGPVSPLMQCKEVDVIDVRDASQLQRGRYIAHTKNKGKKRGEKKGKEKRGEKGKKRKQDKSRNTSQGYRVCARLAATMNIHDTVRLLKGGIQRLF
jgi:hypothetical protein